MAFLDHFSSLPPCLPVLRTSYPQLPACPALRLSPPLLSKIHITSYHHFISCHRSPSVGQALLPLASVPASPEPSICVHTPYVHSLFPQSSQFQSNPTHSNPTQAPKPTSCNCKRTSQSVRHEEYITLHSLPYLAFPPSRLLVVK